MTYLYQLRAHFTGHELEVQQIGKTADESNYIIGRFNTDNDTDVTMQLFGQEIINLRKNKQLNKSSAEKEKPEIKKEVQNQNNEQKTQISKLRLPLTLNITNKPLEKSDEQKEKTPTSAKDVKDILVASSKNIIGKVLSPTRDKSLQNKKVEIKKEKPILMTRRELCDPFGSDDEEDNPELSGDNKTIGHSIESVDNSEKLHVNGDCGLDDDKNNSPDLPKPNPVSTCVCITF